MKHRTATAAEILTGKAFDIRHGSKVGFRHFVTEHTDHRTESGVAHRQHSRSKLRVIDGKPFVKHHGKLERVTADLVTLDSGTTFIYDLRIDSEYLSKGF